MFVQKYAINKGGERELGIFAGLIQNFYLATKYKLDEDIVLLLGGNRTQQRQYLPRLHERIVYHEIPRQADSFMQETALRLMGDCGLRVEETPYVTPADISRKKDGRNYELALMKGKDTTGEHKGGKQRETWMPVELEHQIRRYAREKGLEDDEPLIPRAKTTVQNWVKTAAGRAADETGDTDYKRVSSHDLRRCWAQHLLVEEGVSPRIVMALGG